MCVIIEFAGPANLFSNVCVCQGLNNAVALDFHYAEQMLYWTDVTTQGSMIRRMNINGSNVEVSRAVVRSVTLSLSLRTAGQLASP